MKNKENKRRMSKKARKEFNDLRKELKKANPDPELINYLLNGDTYIYTLYQNDSTNLRQDNK